MKKENMKVIIYARSASPQQNENMHRSLEQQVKACHEYCNQNNLDALMEIRELGSGSACMNTGLAEYLQHVKDTQYNISGIVVADITRVSRDPKTHIAFMQKLEKLDIVLHVASETLMTQMIHAMALAERQNMSKKIKAGIARKKMTQGKIVKFTAKGRNGKQHTYEKEVITHKSKARKVTN